MVKGIWKTEVRKDADTQTLELCHRLTRGIYPKKREEVQAFIDSQLKKGYI